MLWNGVEVQCDHNGWLSTNRCTPAGYVSIQVNVQPHRPQLLMCWRANGQIRWIDVEGMALAIGVIQFGEPIQPLLDWCLENAERRTNLVSAGATALSAECDRWVRDQLEQMIAAAAQTEYQDMED